MRLSLTTKVFLAFTFLLATFAFLAFYSVKELHAIGEDLRRINDDHIALARLAGQLETLQQNRFRDLRRAQAEADPRSRELILRIAAAYFPDVVRARLDEARALLRRRDPGRSEFRAAIATHVERIEAGHAEIDELTDAMSTLARAGASPALLESKLDAIEVALRAEVYQLNRAINDETDRAVRRADRDERLALWRVIALTIVAILVGVALTLLSARALAPIGSLVRYARAISRGDYEQPVRRGGAAELDALAEELVVMAKNRKEREIELDRQQAALEQAYHRVADLSRYHESVVQSLDTAIVVTDRELAVTSANRAAEGVLGPSLRGRRLGELALGEALRARTGPLEALLVTEAGAVRSRRVAQLAHGGQFFDVTITPFLGGRGEVLGLVVAADDVTEAVRTKEALLRSERLAAIGRISAHVTHEVRNPLSSIGLNAELLDQLLADAGLEAAAADEAQTLSRAIGREVDRLTAITEDYLRFARLPRPELEPGDPGLLVASIAAFVRADLAAHHVELVVERPEHAPSVDLDRDQLRQVILNLVRNGREAMPTGGTLTLAVEPEAGPDGDGCVIAVRDTGVGISPADRERIFDPFFSTKLTGTGLGLALVHQIVQEHGGQITVRSAAGSGTEFRIWLPVRRKDGVSSPAVPRAPALLEDDA